MDVTYTTFALIAQVQASAGSQPSTQGDTIEPSVSSLAVPPFPAMLTDVEAFVVTRAFINQLAVALPSPYASNAPQLMSDGFVLAQATDTTGQQGQSGVALYEVYGTGSSARTELITSSRATYLGDTLTSVSAAMVADATVTGATGLVVGPMFGNFAQYIATVPGDTYLQAGTPQYETHLTGSMAGTVTIVFFRRVQ